MWKCKCGCENQENVDVCNQCGSKKPLKHSVLGIVGFALSLVPCLSLVGSLLCIIDIMGKKKKKIGLSIAGLIIGILSTMLGSFLFVMIGSSDELDSVSENAAIESAFDDVVEETIASPSPSPSPEPTPEPTPEPEPELDPAEVELAYKESCQEYDYKTVMRNPDDYIGQRIKVEVRISVVKKESALQNQYYFVYDKENPEDTWYFNNEYCIWECRDENDPSYFKLLEGDIIMVYGEIAEPQDTVSLITNSEELFSIEMKYAELISE